MKSLAAQDSVENQKTQMALIGKSHPKEDYMKANTIACTAVRKTLDLPTKPKKADKTPYKKGAPPHETTTRKASV